MYDFVIHYRPFVFVAVEEAIMLVFTSEIFQKITQFWKRNHSRPFFFHVEPEDTTYNAMSTRHIFFVFTTEFKVVLACFKWFVTSVSCSLNILPAAHLAAFKASTVSRIQAHPSFLPHSTVAILGSTLSLFTLV